MGVYTRLQDTAVKLIAKYGKNVTLTPGLTTPLDADKPWRGNNPDGDTPSTPKGLVASFDIEEIDGARIQTTDIKLLVAATDPVVVADSLDLAAVVSAEVDGVSYAALLIESVKPGPDAVVFIYRLRKDA